jgi:hypothetical protein
MEDFPPLSGVMVDGEEPMDAEPVEALAAGVVSQVRFLTLL